MLQALRLLLPALIPSWNFFDVIAASPRIEYARTRTSAEAVTHWREFRPRPPHISPAAMLARLVWNHDWNEALFAVACAERLLADPTDHSEDELFHRIAADLTGGSDGGGEWLRFRIGLVSEEQGALVHGIAYVSDPRRLAAIR